MYTSNNVQNPYNWAPQREVSKAFLAQDEESVRSDEPTMKGTV